MTQKSQSASQPTRRSIGVPSWVWSLVLLAAAASALSVYHSAQGAPAPSVSLNPPAWMVQAQPSYLNVQRAASSAWDVPAEGSSLTNYGQTQHLADFARQRAAANTAARMVQAQESNSHYGLPLADAPAVVRGRARQTVEESILQRNAEPVWLDIDPAIRSVLIFVGRYGLQYASEAPEVVMDAGALSYTDYLRRHGLLPAIDPAGPPIDPQVQAMIDSFRMSQALASLQADGQSQAAETETEREILDRHNQ